MGFLGDFIGCGCSGIMYCVLDGLDDIDVYVVFKLWVYVGVCVCVRERGREKDRFRLRLFNINVIDI